MQILSVQNFWPPLREWYFFLIAFHGFPQPGEDVVMGLGVSGLKTHSVWLGDHHRGCGRQIKYGMISRYLKHDKPRTPRSTNWSERGNQWKPLALGRLGRLGVFLFWDIPSGSTIPSTFHGVFVRRWSMVASPEWWIVWTILPRCRLFADAQIWVNMSQLYGFPVWLVAKSRKDVRHRKTLQTLTKSKLWSSLWIGWGPQF